MEDNLISRIKRRLAIWHALVAVVLAEAQLQGVADAQAADRRCGDLSIDIHRRRRLLQRRLHAEWHLAACRARQDALQQASDRPAAIIRRIRVMP